MRHLAPNPEQAQANLGHQAAAEACSPLSERFFVHDANANGFSAAAGFPMMPMASGIELTTPTQSSAHPAPRR
jgi:hypothetical protein